MTEPRRVPELTQVEGEALGLQMTAHRSQKCKRCKCREDLTNASEYKINPFVCCAGKEVDRVMSALFLTCHSFILDEDQSRWLP